MSLPVQKDNIPATQSEHDEVRKILKSASKKTFPKTMTPMLATLVDEPFDGDDWVYEIKWDGYRAIAFRKGKLTEIKSRNNMLFVKPFLSKIFSGVF